MVQKPWRIIPRPLMETILNNHAHHARVPQPLILHGPRGVGKTTLILQRLLEDWNTGPHITGYVDFSESIKSHHPTHGGSYPWCSWSTAPPPSLTTLQSQLECALESMAEHAVSLGTIGSHHIFSVLNKWHGVSSTLPKAPKRVSASNLWGRAVAARLGSGGEEVGGVVKKGSDEAAYVKEAMAALRLAKEVLGVQKGWRANAVRHLNSVGGFSRSLANSATDWPCLLLELLSAAAELDYFQPKLVINNVEILKHAVLADDSTVRGSLYHDSLIWRIIALGANERCLPVILVTSDRPPCEHGHFKLCEALLQLDHFDCSDYNIKFIVSFVQNESSKPYVVSYYSYRAFIDFGFPDIFISRETFGWTPQEAKMHMVGDYFSESEWRVVVEVLGPSPRHLFELHALKLSNFYHKAVDSKNSTFEDIVDSYLAYLQVTVVDPAMDKALSILKKFANDARSGKIPKNRLRFGAPWKHPPPNDSSGLDSEWAKLQLMDFIQSLVKTEFGVNYLADCSLEIFDDPSVLALIEVGLLYAQRDPSFIRPISRGIQRCLVRWLVQQKMKLSSQRSLQYMWHRFIRGRSYRHLMLEVGFNKF